MIKFIFSIAWYLLLVYFLILIPQYLYLPTREFSLPFLMLLVRFPILYIHEAGHFFFGFFGKTVMFMGGSLMQLLVPLVWYFFARKENSSLQYLALFITGFSICDVSLYMKDAGMLLLPLIGGLSKVHHDWANIFSVWGLLDESYAIGEVVFWIGMFVAVFAIYSGVKEAVTECRSLHSS